MKHITSYNLQELKGELSLLGLEPYRASQILNWLYKKLVFDFEFMTNLSKEHRKLLRENFRVHVLELLEKVPAPDATKFLFKTHDGHMVETVLIMERDHLTLCVSSQIGCAVGCTFCATAIDGLKRNLSAGEIIDQYLLVQQYANQRIRNVVFMGMGEPLANYENVRKAVEIMTSSWGLDLSKRRVTVSTSGLVAQLKRMAKDKLMREVNLAVSLNSPDNKEREGIMPLTKRNTIKELMNVLRSFPLPKYRRITIEYVLIDGLNDSEKHASKLISILGKDKKRFKVNLIPFNPDPNLPYRRPSLERVISFQRILWEAGVSTFVRFSKGVDVFGACGQLRAKRVMIKSHIHEKTAEVAN